MLTQTIDIDQIFLQSDVEAVAIRMKEQFLTYGKGKLDMEHGQSEWLEENPFGLDQIGKGMFQSVGPPCTG